MVIIPAIDIINGRCVRLSQGDYNRMTIYDNNPVDVAKNFQDLGFEYLHLVDLDGAKSGKIKNFQILEEINQSTNLKVDFSGGIRNIGDIKNVLDCGTNKVTIGSLAVDDQILFIEFLQKYSDKIILSADVKEENIHTNGWYLNRKINIFSFVESFPELKNIICTDILCDGMFNGPNFGLYKKLIDFFPDINIIASGGISSIHQLRILRDIGIQSVIIGKSIYENKINIEELCQENQISKKD